MQAKKSLQTYGRLLTTLIIVAVVLAAFGGVHEYRAHHSNGMGFRAQVACDILTPTIVKNVAGPGLTEQNLKPLNTSMTSTTFCAFRGSQTSVSLVVRAAKNKQGIALNRAAFASPPLSSEVVHGYGDAAYWTPAFGQFNVLSHNTWYILSNGPSTPSQRTLAQSEKLAAQILPKL